MSLATDLARRAGELIVGGYPEPGAPPSAFLARLARGHLGGVILFARNLPSLTAAQEIGPALARTPLPDGTWALAAVDEEGGFVQRLPAPWPRLPGAMGIAMATDDPARVRRYARALGTALRALGILQDYAPVLDINSEPDNPVIGPRSFGDDPSIVARLGVAFAQGLEEGGVLATAKHFPGHGDTRTDSHHALPVLPLTREVLALRELLPFRAAVGAGVGAIMTAHIALPAVTQSPDLPATLSPAVLTDLLRGELGFEGLIVTDCLEMAAVRDTYGVAEGAVRAVAAGADQVLISHTAAYQEAAREALADAIAHGRIAVDRVAEALARIDAVRQRTRKIPAAPALDVALADLRREADALAADAVARYGPAWGKGTSERIAPLYMVLPGGDGPPRWHGLGAAASEAVVAVIGQQWPHVVLRVDRDGIPLEAKAPPHDAVTLAVVPSLRQHPGWATLLAQLPKPLWVIAAEDPYDAARLDADRVVVCDPAPAALRTAVAVLVGAQAVPGRLPVSRFPEGQAPPTDAGFTAVESPPA